MQLHSELFQTLEDIKALYALVVHDLSDRPRSALSAENAPLVSFGAFLNREVPSWPKDLFSVALVKPICYCATPTIVIYADTINMTEYQESIAVLLYQVEQRIEEYARRMNLLMNAFQGVIEFVFSSPTAHVQFFGKLSAQELITSVQCTKLASAVLIDSVERWIYKISRV